MAMNRLNVFTVAVALAAASGWPASSAKADRALMSVHAGGVALTIGAADDGEQATIASGDAVVDVGSNVGPDLNIRPFIPDVYPSRADAARALGERWAATAVRPGERQPARVRVMSDDPSLFVPVREGVRAKVDKLRVEPCDGTLCREQSAAPGEAWLYVTLPGGNELSIRSAGAWDAAATAAYIDKPWVSNFAGFLARTPGHWLVAHSDSDRPATSPAEAAEQARGAAVDQVTPMVMARMRNVRRYDAGSVRRIVERHLAGDRLVRDRFPQKFERPYGSLYREALLIDSSDEQLDPLARTVRASLDAERQSRLGGLASAAAVLLVTYALYRFANAFTRGYFTWSLRTAAAVVAAGAVVLIVAVA
jgi:(2Fe-2S) ferredoxin